MQEIYRNHFKSNIGNTYNGTIITIIVNINIIITCFTGNERTK